MTTTIQIRMKDNTLKSVDKIQKVVHSPSRSDAVRRAVEISDILISAIERGEKIIIETKSGKQRQILISGLNT